MARQLFRILDRPMDRSAVQSSVKRAKEASASVAATVEMGSSEYRDFIRIYHDLITDLYEYGWGRSFHFAPRVPGESFEASLARLEHCVAHVLGLRPGMRVADLGCGVGGPAREIARFSGAEIVGVNINAYQIGRARELTADAGLSHLASFVESDFADVDQPDDSFDAVYTIEATCHADDRAAVFAEAFRLLKPGGGLVACEWCMTDRFDADDVQHRKLKNDIEFCNAVQGLGPPRELDIAVREVGFELLETRDLAITSGPAIPWYQPLVGAGLSLAHFRSTTVGRWVTVQSLRLLEQLRVVPKGTPEVARMLSTGAAAIAEAGRLGIFTPSYFVQARKPA